MGMTRMKRALFLLLSSMLMALGLSVFSIDQTMAQSVLSLDREAELARIGRLEAQAKKMNQAAILSGQSAQVSAAVGRVTPGIKGKAEVFFVGFAGDGTQDVFLSEVQVARDAVVKRYGVENHALILVNNLQSINRFPLASQSNLNQALKAVAKKMNGPEDVLFFFLTSHGMPNGFASTQLPGFKTEHLSAVQLRDGLDKSGIKNRIIVLSTCFAGSFIPALKNDDTLIITAAAANRTSFGCANERKLTFFGDAFFEQALPSAPTLIAAYNTATEKIGEWERRDNVTNSQPQILMGANIGAVLEKIEAPAK
jgi:Peptidase C13 family